jgi:hypothetical protein
MQIVVHCGLDKAGSTAIQAHVALFRSWLLGQGVYVPLHCLTGFGHVALFRDLSKGNWQPLLDELSTVDQTEYPRCFLSYEGICRFDQQTLARIAEYLEGHQVTVLFYLREQAEVIQSGYLQQLKSQKHDVSIAHLNSDYSLLALHSRNYFHMLQKFESVFGRQSIALRPYQPAAWRDGSILWDLLDFLQCEPDRDFVPAGQQQNISLDAQAAEILNIFDVYGSHGAGRTALVEDLLWLIEKYPGGSRYVLDQHAVAHIRDAYSDSNARLAQRYGLEFAYRDCVTQAVPESSDGRVSYARELAKLARYSRWAGEPLEGRALDPLVKSGAGWSRVESWGVWSRGDVSSLQFRVPLSRISGMENSLNLHFDGRYFAGNTATEVRVNGELLGNFDLRDTTVKVALQQLDENRVLSLDLHHGAAASPAELELGEDTRRLAFGLQGIRYKLVV